MILFLPSGSLIDDFLEKKITLLILIAKKAHLVFSSEIRPSLGQVSHAWRGLQIAAFLNG